MIIRSFIKRIFNFQNDNTCLDISNKGGNYASLEQWKE